MKLDQMTKLEGGRYQDVDGCILPWYTSPCLEWMVSLDLKEKVIFEYGIGDSSLWYERQGAYNFGIESNEDWWMYVVSKSAHKNPYTFTKSKERYLLGENDHRILFDLIIIDGLYRDECTEYALKVLKPSGYLIIDNWKQPSVEEHWPLTEKLIEGMPITIYKEPEHYDWVTAVVQKP